jgi:glycosyltransferase involved in cell wall biosynthesis
MTMFSKKATPTSKCHGMVVHAYYPLGETRVEREAQALVRQSYEVDIICLRKDGELPVESVGGVTVYRLPVQRHKGHGLAMQMLEYLVFFALAFAKLVALHRRRQYRVVQVHNLPDFLVFAALWPKLRGARVILDLHDLMPEFYAARFGGSLARWPVRLVRWQERLSCRFADHVITVSEHWRRTLIERGVPAHKCSVVMNVADEGIFHWQENNHHHSRSSKFQLIYHGTVVQRYGLDLAIQAVDRVRHEIPDIHLLILGKGEYIDTLARMTQELNLNHHVTIVNDLRPAAELPEIIRAADAGIVPYRNDVFTDGLLPTKLMEYAALGLPAIAARTTAIEAYFSDTMVEFFRPGDVDDLARCIHTLRNSPQRMAELARGSATFNQRYNWARLGADYVALVERLGNR